MLRIFFGCEIRKKKKVCLKHILLVLNCAFRVYFGAYSSLFSVFDLPQVQIASDIGL